MLLNYEKLLIIKKYVYCNGFYNYGHSICFYALGYIIINGMTFYSVFKLGKYY
jgi:hypothetical protein